MTPLGSRGFFVVVFIFKIRFHIHQHDRSANQISENVIRNICFLTDIVKYSN